jgi:hypothetical protein
MYSTASHESTIRLMERLAITWAFQKWPFKQAPRVVAGAGRVIEKSLKRKPA